MRLLYRPLNLWIQGGGRATFLGGRRGFEPFPIAALVAQQSTPPATGSKPPSKAFKRLTPRCEPTGGRARASIQDVSRPPLSRSGVAAVTPSGSEPDRDGSSDSVATWLPFQPGKGWSTRVGGGSARNGPNGPNGPQCLDFQCKSAPMPRFWSTHLGTIQFPMGSRFLSSGSAYPAVPPVYVSGSKRLAARAAV